MNFTYIFCLTIIFLVSVFASIKLKVITFFELKYIIPSILLSGSLFVFLGTRISDLGIVSYNPEYLVGIFLAGLPMEEYIYLVVLPFFFLTYYLWVKRRNPHQKYYNYYIVLSLILLVIFIAATYFGRKYFFTLIVFLFLSVFFGYVFFRNLLKEKYPSYYIALAGSFIVWFAIALLKSVMPIMIPEPEYISGVGLIAVPVEEAGHYLLLYLMNITAYEYLSERKFY